MPFCCEARGHIFFIATTKAESVSKNVNPLGVPADLKSAVKKGSTYK